MAGRDRTTIGPKLGRALAALWLVVSAPVAAARPSVDEAASFARRELSRLCDDRDLSRFDRIDDAEMFRTCAARLAPGRLAIEVRYRALEGDNPSSGFARRSGSLETVVDFDPTSRFFCGREPREGRVGLYFTCATEIDFHGAACVARTETQRRSDQRVISQTRRQAVAKLLELEPASCATLENALNFVASKSRPSLGTDVQSYFQR